MTDSRRPERKKSSAKKAAILNGAMQVFLAKGYAATSMDAVAEVASVSKATIYSHFNDKASLFTALIEDLAADKFRAAAISPRNSETSSPPRQVLAELAHQLLNEIDRDPQSCEFMRLLIGESGRFPELAVPYIQHVAKPIIESLTQYLDESEQLTVPDPEATARTFIGSLVYFTVLQRVLGGDSLIPMARDRMVNNLVTLVCGQPKLS